LGREQAYLGVLVDDLVTRDIAEPYRMMTSRAEYRLLLRQDNADLRLSSVGYEVGLLPEARYRLAEAKRRAIAEELERLDHIILRPGPELDGLLRERGLDCLREATRASQFLRRPGASYAIIEALAPSERRPGGSVPLDPPELWTAVAEQVEMELRYEGYITKQQRQVERARRLETWRIPEAFDYDGVVGLRYEARESLMGHRPETMGQASRLRGVNPADISVLLVYLERAARGAPKGDAPLGVSGSEGQG